MSITFDLRQPLALGNGFVEAMRAGPIVVNHLGLLAAKVMRRFDF